MPEQTELKNCPHCGKELNIKVESDVPIKIGRHGTRWHIFTCRDCGKTVSMVPSDVMRQGSTGFETD